MRRSIVFVLGAMLASHCFGESQRVTGLEFERVLVVGSVEVEISQGAESELVLRGTEEELGLQPFFLDGDVLVLGRSKEHRASRFSDVQYKLTADKLRHLELKGAGEVYVKPLQVRDFFVSLDGSGDVKMFGIQGEDLRLAVNGSGDLQVVEISAGSLRVVCSGSGNVALGSLTAGKVKASLSGSGDISVSEPSDGGQVEINIVGSGDIDFAELNTREAQVNIMGSGDARIGRVEQLEVNIVGSGGVSYRGNPELDKSILGSGGLQRDD